MFTPAAITKEHTMPTNSHETLTWPLAPHMLPAVTLTLNSSHGIQCISVPLQDIPFSAWEEAAETITPAQADRLAEKSKEVANTFDHEAGKEVLSRYFQQIARAATERRAEHIQAAIDDLCR